MPKRKDIKKILIIGSGPIVIGQACEFDYSGAQACKALRAEGYKVILVNSNPATIMTDPELAHRTYIEPLTKEYIEEIIAKEKPDALLPTVGGQTALNLASGTLIEEATLGINRQATGNRSPIAGPSDIFRVTDGWIVVQVIGQPLFKRWAEMMGAPELLDDPRFRDDIRRGENGKILSDIMAGWCASRSRKAALDELEAARIPAGPVYSPREVLEDASIRASGAFSWLGYPGLSRAAPIVAPPARLSRTPPSIESRPPTIGEHTDEILKQIGYGPAEIHHLREMGVV